DIPTVINSRSCYRSTLACTNSKERGRLLGLGEPGRLPRCGRLRCSAPWGRDGDPWHGMVGDAHALDCVEAMALSRTAREMAAGEWFRTTVSCCSRTRSAD